MYSSAVCERAESPGPTYGKLVSKLRFNARILYGMYLGLTVLEILFLTFGGMPLFDSLTHTFGTAGTGGFSIYANGIMHYDNVYYEMVISVFMLLFGVNFNFYYFLLIRRFSAAFRIAGSFSPSTSISTLTRPPMW